MASLREWTEILRDLLRLPARRQFERDLFKMLRSEVPVILLVGPTGSGKSSFVKSLTDKAVLVSPEESCTLKSIGGCVDDAGANR
jgi:50S ribosomal subunit-associated GTPase HflX